MDFMLFITPLERTLGLYRDQIPTHPSASVGTGWNETAGRATTFTRALLRNQSFSAKYADIFEKQTTILSWTGGYTVYNTSR